MKKIAILTQPLKANYGGILQAFALQLILKKFGHKVVTIDRKPKPVSLLREILIFLKNILLKLISNKNRKYFTKKQLNFIYTNSSNFIGSNIVMSKYIDSTKDLKSHFERSNYDIVIVGSDQVWRPIFSPNIYDYFLDFLLDNKKIRKISYAPSFGTDEWEFSEIETKKCKNLIQYFDAVSVREFSAIELCKDYLNANAQLVLDPTLLLEKKDYIKVIKTFENKLPDRIGIFTYILDKSEDKNKIIKRTSELLDLPVFDNQPKEIYGLSNSSEINDYKYPPVEGWLNSFLKANFVITDSFHGVIFSILFNKNFIAIGNNERGLSRFKSLLLIFNLEDRLIGNTLQEKLVFKKIDFEKVNRILDNLRAESIDFLKKNI